MPFYSTFSILNMKYGLNVTLFFSNMQPCATSRLTINSYRFCSWEKVPGEPSKYCSFAYREEPNRNVLSPCFSLVFKGVAGVNNLVPHHSSTLDSFFIRYAQSKQKATYWRIWNRRDTKRRGAAYRVTSELNECVWKLYRTAARFGMETNTKCWLHSRKTQGTPTTIWVVHTRQRLPTSLRFIPQLTQSKWTPE